MEKEEEELQGLRSECRGLKRRVEMVYFYGILEGYGESGNQELDGSYEEGRYWIYKGFLKKFLEMGFLEDFIWVLFIFAK